MKLLRGQQIACVPDHVRDECKNDWEWFDHPDTELGFVWEDKGENVLCRYWSKYAEGDLRTKANSELTPKRLLEIYDSVDTSLIVYWVEKINHDQMKWLLDSIKNTPADRIDPNPTVVTCSKCGVEWKETMMYSCPHSDCPIQPQIIC